MYITAATLSMDASHTYKEVEQRVSGLTGTGTPVNGQSDAFGIRLASMLASSCATEICCASEVSRAASSNNPTEAPREATDSGGTTLLSQVTRQVTGQSVRIKAFQDSLTTSTTLRALQQGSTASSPLQSVSFPNGTMYSEATSLLYSAQGTVRTEDGREIGFDLGLSMEQNTVAAQTASFAATGLFIDPLMLQFDLDSPLLSDTSFLFDLDSDGDMEELACPGSGCGFLAFDRNGDGRINNGTELFGPESGSGFGELAQLDSDANLWIDENDPIFSQLLIWTVNGEGDGHLCSLKEAGVGAIAVTHAGTNFQLRKTDGRVQGTIAASGLFLTEEGEVRPMQEVDLAVDASQDAAGAVSSSGLWPGGRARNQVLQALHDIIAMQRLRLKMMLTGQRLHSALEKKAQQQVFFDWISAQHQWREQFSLHAIEQQTGSLREQNKSTAT